MLGMLLSLFVKNVSVAIFKVSLFTRVNILPGRQAVNENKLFLIVQKKKRGMGINFFTQGVQDFPMGKDFQF